ncbi:MAG: hypothetical protein RRA15_02925 [bacterium]|nr:hypothetical protein [bacterium]
MLSFELGKYENDSDDTSSDGSGGVKVLLGADQVYTKVLECRVKVFKVDNRA